MALVLFHLKRSNVLYREICVAVKYASAILLFINLIPQAKGLSQGAGYCEAPNSRESQRENRYRCHFPSMLIHKYTIHTS